MNTARAALSTFIFINGKPVGSQPLVIRYLKGVFALRPSLPKYQVTWHVQQVLEYLRTLWPLSALSLQKLSHKLAMLCLLLTGQRGQTVHMFDIHNISRDTNSYRIRIGDPVKQTRPGYHIPEIYLPSFSDEKICIVHTLDVYLLRTRYIRGTVTKLFVSPIKPHAAVSRDTISRWVKQVLRASGVDITIFSPHSTRAAATSAAHRARVPLQTILSTAGWTSARTFARHYNKPLQSSCGFPSSVYIN